MSLTRSLEALVAEHDRIGSPLRSRLGPGVPAARVEASLAGLGLRAPAEVLELYGWHEIQDAPGDQSRVEWFWPAAPLRLDEAIETYRRNVQVDEGGQTLEAFDELVRTHDPTQPFTGFWRIDWLPILYEAPEQYAIECGESPDRASGAAVWRVNWHPDDALPTKRLTPSLTAFVDRVVEIFRLGGYAWSPERRSLVTVDAVFEREGLGHDVRPWPSRS